MDPSDFDMLAASLRSNTDDAQTYLIYLATKMTSALPTQTTVERRGLFRQGPPRKVSVALGEHAYVVEEQRGQLVASRNHIVRGIELSREQVDFQYWTTKLVEDLQALAEQSAVHRNALERLTLG